MEKLSLAEMQEITGGISKKEYCKLLVQIYSNWSDEKVAADSVSSYGFIEAYRDHCM